MIVVYFSVFSLRGMRSEDLRILKEKLQQEVSFAWPLAFVLISLVKYILHVQIKIPTPSNTSDLMTFLLI